MTVEKREKRRCGFVLVDLAAVVGVGMFIAGLVLVSGAETRRQAGLGKCIQQLRQQGVATGSYAADHADLIWTYSWKAGDRLSQWDDLNNSTSDLQAAAYQAVDILRRRVDPEFPRISGWIPHVMYNHLVLVDYLDLELPNEAAACPEDEARRCWQAHSDDFCVCPARPSCIGIGRRWPFSSSYDIGPAFYADQGVSQAGRHSFYGIRGGAVLGGRVLGEVRYPSQKALAWETTAWHFGSTPIWHAYKEARLPVVFVDGSVSVRGTGDANQGWHPRVPDSPEPTTYLYRPSPSWERPTLSGETEELVIGHYRWTRGGLAGRDFGGPEVWD